jgi:hypothetical protein
MGGESVGRVLDVRCTVPVDVVLELVVELGVVGVLLDGLGGEGLAEELVLAIGQVRRDGQARRLPEQSQNFGSVPCIGSYGP